MQKRVKYFLIAAIAVLSFVFLDGFGIALVGLAERQLILEAVGVAAGSGALGFVAQLFARLQQVDGTEMKKQVREVHRKLLDMHLGSQGGVA